MNSVRRRAGREDLVLNAPDEGFVHEFCRLDIGRKHHHGHEGKIDLLTGLQGQVVDVRLERDDPAVQQLTWRADPCRPKSSMTSTPPLATACTGAR